MMRMGRKTTRLRHRNLPLLLLQAREHVISHFRPILNAHANVTHLGAQLGDFTDTAAVIACLDLVIAADTSVAHLAGAMGKPVWLMLPFSPDWRWMLNRADSPWYPSARLFRQTALGDWGGVVAQVRAELAAH